MKKDQSRIQRLIEKAKTKEAGVKQPMPPNMLQPGQEAKTFNGGKIKLGTNLPSRNTKRSLINMSAVERNILTVVEPTIVLDELEITDVESGTENSDGETMKEKPSKFSTMIPLIRINSYEVQGDRLETFELKCTGFYPTCKFSFYDRDGMFTARFFPKGWGL